MSGKFPTAYNGKHKPTGESNSGELKTVPDQTMSIREILHRHVHGYPVNIPGKMPIYKGEDDDPDFEHMDFAERQEATDFLKSELDKTTQRINKRNQKPKKDPTAEDKPAQGKGHNTSGTQQSGAGSDPAKQGSGAPEA